LWEKHGRPGLIGAASFPALQSAPTNHAPSTQVRLFVRLELLARLLDISPLLSEKERFIMRKLLNDQNGFVVSAELVLVLTIAVLGMVVGLASVRDSITAELVDLSNAFGAADQSYNVVGLSKNVQVGLDHARIAGFGFNDDGDDCDCKPLTITEVCGKNDPSTGAAGEDN
jgi:hypothetical protein